MLQLCRINPVEDPRHIDQRCRNHLAGNHSSLVQVQSPRARENHGPVLLKSHRPVALLVVIAELAPQARQNVGHPGFVMRPLVHAGIFQIEHHAGRA